MNDNMFEGGWIKIYSSIIKHPVFTCGDSKLFQLFMYCLFSAYWKDTDYVTGATVLHLKKGQFVTGRKKLVKDLTGLVRESSKDFKKQEFLYRRKLFILQEMNILHIKSSNKYSVITIQNWDKYQSNAQQMHNKRTTDAQQMHTKEEYKELKNKTYKEKKNVFVYKDKEYSLDEYHVFQIEQPSCNLPPVKKGLKIKEYLNSLNFDDAMEYAVMFGGRT